MESSNKIKENNVKNNPFKTKVEHYLESQDINEWVQIRLIHIRQLSVKQHRSGLSSNSIALLLSSSRSFFQYLIGLKLLDINPTKNIRPPNWENGCQKLWIWMLTK
jgi:site-specific recombinase XerC